MKKTAYLVSILIFSLFLMGMGTTGGSAPVKVPEPEVNYTVAMVDRSDVSMDLEKFSCDGELFISGDKGNARISIPFDKIASVNFFLEDEILTADIKLKDNTSVTLIVEKDQPCYGTIRYGSIKIDMVDIKSITFRDSDQRSEVNCQKTEVRCQRTGDKCQMSEERCQRTEVRE